MRRPAPLTRPVRSAILRPVVFGASLALLGFVPPPASAQAPPSTYAGLHPDAAWTDLSNPNRKLALRDSKLWLLDSGRVVIAFPVVGGGGNEIEICWADQRTTLHLTENGTAMTIKGTLSGEFHRLSAMPKELELTPAPVAAPQPLPQVKVAEVQAELTRRGDLDQKVRTGETHDFAEMTKVDADNTAYFKKLIAEVGWIDTARFGAEAGLVAFLIVQHSDDVSLMLAALPALRREMKPGTPHDTGSASYALLYDRLTLTLGGLQRYGSQIGIQPGGRKVLRAMEDAEHVDARRKELGMEPLAAYVARFGVTELPRIDDHCREVGFIRAAGAPEEDGAAKSAPASGGTAAPVPAAPAATAAQTAGPAAAPPVPTALGRASRSLPAEGVAWRDVSDPAHRVALRGGRLWFAEKGRLARALPVVSSEPGRLWVCTREGNRKAIDADVEGDTLTLAGEEVGSYRRLEALPSELILLPLDWPAAKPLPASQVEPIQQELTRRSRYAKLPLGSREALDKTKIDDLDAESSSYLRKLAAEVGWIDEARFGPEAARTALNIVQHSADLRLIQTALPEIRKEVAAHADPGLAEAYANLFDRFQLATGAWQRYGTQLGQLSDKTLVIRPVEDPKQVEARRKELGLGPLSDLLAQAGAPDALFLDTHCQPIPAGEGR